MSTRKIWNAVLQTAADHAAARPLRTHLDIGPGRGELLALIRERFGIESRACDYTDQLMQLPGQKVDIADLNQGGLPYPDNAFDLVTAIEVVEHLEHYRDTLRETFRVLAPRGMCILSTPNILNLNSRLRYLWCGFWVLFGPLPVKHGARQSLGGHINPVSCFYLAHALYDAGFTNIRLRVDKFQRSAFPKLILLAPFIHLFAWAAWRRERRKRRSINPDNAPLVSAINSLPMLLGRTIIVSAVKP